MKEKTPYQILQQQEQLTYEQARLILQIDVIMSKWAYLTRAYIIERITGLGDPQATINELLKLPAKGNQLAERVPGFTGNFIPIMTAYIEGLQDLIDGMISEDQEEADESVRRLYEIAEANAAYLAQQSPYWDEDRWQAFFYEDINSLIQEIIAIELGDFDRALNIFETIMGEASIEGEYYAEGIIHLLPEAREKIPAPYFNMIKDLRRLFIQLVYLTRFYAVSEITGLGSSDELTERLYQWPQTMATKMELLFGSEAAEQLSTILTVYVVQLEQIIDAILTEGDIEEKENEFRAYTEELAAFLSSINPYWDEGQFEEYLDVFAELLFTEITQLKDRDYAGTMKTFEEFLDAALAIADYWALGLYQYSISDSSTS